MSTISSRPYEVLKSLPSEQDVLDAAQPSIRILEYITRNVTFTDATLSAVAEASRTIADILNCMDLFDYEIIPVSNTGFAMEFEVIIMPFEHAAEVVLKVKFRVTP